MRNHDMYYFLSNGMSDPALARFMSKVSGGSVNGWYIFFNSEMWALPAPGILSYKVSGQHYKFHRFARWLIQIIFKRKGIPKDKRDFKIIHDWRRDVIQLSKEDCKRGCSDIIAA
jgi:hypothetical protein